MEKLKKEIEKAKSKLRSIANKKGLCENFGQSEVKKLEEKYNSPQEMVLINQFDEWCMNYEIYG